MKSKLLLAIVIIAIFINCTTSQAAKDKRVALLDNNPYFHTYANNSARKDALNGYLKPKTSATYSVAVWTYKVTKWVSTNKKVATVKKIDKSRAKVTAKKCGTCYIKAKINNKWIKKKLFVVKKLPKETYYYLTQKQLKEIIARAEKKLRELGFISGEERMLQIYNEHPEWYPNGIDLKEEAKTGAFFQYAYSGYIGGPLEPNDYYNAIIETYTEGVENGDYEKVFCFEIENSSNHKKGETDNLLWHFRATPKMERETGCGREPYEEDTTVYSE